MIVFHSVDLDGWMSAALTRKYLDQGELVYATYKQDAEAVRRIKAAKPKTLYVVDYSFENDVFDEIIDLCGEVIWYDHHADKIEGATEKMKALKGRRSVEKVDRVSAAWLVYQDCPQSKKVERLVKLASDYDVFMFDDDNPLSCDAPKFNSWVGFDRGGALEQVERMRDLIDGTTPARLKTILIEGSSMLHHEINNATVAAKRAVFGSYDGMRFAAINSAGMNPAYVCKPHQMSCAFVFCWYMLSDGRIKMDLRSDKNTGADVGRIAKAWDGGGHEHAAGCVVTLDTLLELGGKHDH